MTIDDSATEQKIDQVVRAVGTPIGIKSRAAWLVQANPNADVRELAMIIRDEINTALAAFIQG